MEESRDRVSQFASKLAEARRWVVHVTSSQRLHEDKLKMDESMSRAASDPSTLKSPFLMF
jgi:hypothetical protein